LDKRFNNSILFLLICYMLIGFEITCICCIYETMNEYYQKYSQSSYPICIISPNFRSFVPKSISFGFRINKLRLVFGTALRINIFYTFIYFLLFIIRFSNVCPSSFKVIISTESTITSLGEVDRYIPPVANSVCNIETRHL